ncbi:MAG: hypothetical protein WAM85_25000, partial [Terracidiphilus sp.]
LEKHQWAAGLLPQSAASPDYLRLTLFIPSVTRWKRVGLLRMTLHLAGKVAFYCRNLWFVAIAEVSN